MNKRLVFKDLIRQYCIKCNLQNQSEIFPEVKFNIEKFKNNFHNMDIPYTADTFNIIDEVKSIFVRRLGYIKDMKQIKQYLTTLWR